MARVDWVDSHGEGGWLLCNLEKGSKCIYISSAYVLKMTGKPLVVETLQVVPRLPPWQVKEIEEEYMTAFTIMWHSSAVCDVLHMEENARMNLISKKINWLEDDSYPADRPRKHWLVWFHKLSRVEGASVVCMQCRATRSRSLT